MSNMFSRMVDYPMPDGQVLFSVEDIRYMQNQIRTHRAVHTDAIDGSHAGRYYEAAITLLEVFNYITECGLQLIPSTLSVTIDPADESTRVSVNCYTRDHYYVVNNKPYGYRFDLTYSPDGVKPDLVGYYQIRLNTNDMPEANGISIGTCKFKDIMKVPGTMPEELCFPIGPDAMRFSSCFPTPAYFKSMIIGAWGMLHNNHTKHEEELTNEQAV